MGTGTEAGEDEEEGVIMKLSTRLLVSSSSLTGASMTGAAAAAAAGRGRDEAEEEEAFKNEAEMATSFSSCATLCDCASFFK